MVTILPSIISGLAVVISAWVARKVQQVHVLVNSGYDAMKTEIEDLKSQRDLKRDEESK